MTIAYLSTVKAFSPQKLKKPTHVSLLRDFYFLFQQGQSKTHPTHLQLQVFCFHLSEFYNCTSPTLFP